MPLIALESWCTSGLLTKCNAHISGPVFIYVSTGFILVLFSYIHICCKWVDIATTWSNYIIGMSLSVYTLIDTESCCPIVVNLYCFSTFLFSDNFFCLTKSHNNICIIVLEVKHCAKKSCLCHLWMCTAGVPCWCPLIVILLSHLIFWFWGLDHPPYTGPFERIRWSGQVRSDTLTWTLWQTHSNLNLET